MMPALAAIAVTALTYGILSVVEILYHRLRHNQDRTYWWGVWVFAILAGLYTFVNSLGRF